MPRTLLKNNIEQMLYSALCKAEDNGWDMAELIKYQLDSYTDKYMVVSPAIHWWVFEHDFAKAFWGKNWLSHLKNMVAYEDPLEYLEKFIK